MSLKKKTRVQERAEEIKLILEAINEEIDGDMELAEYLYSDKVCLKCGSIDYEEIIDETKGKIFCCSDCPEESDHH